MSRNKGTIFLVLALNPYTANIFGSESCLLIAPGTYMYIDMHSRMLLSCNANTMNPDQTAPKKEQSNQGS